MNSIRKCKIRNQSISVGDSLCHCFHLVYTFTTIKFLVLVGHPKIFSGPIWPPLWNISGGATAPMYGRTISFQERYHSASANSSALQPYDSPQSFTHCNSSTQRGTSEWAAEEQNKFISRSKKSWRDHSLTFLLSSISCSNMALNTGERAGSSYIRTIC